MSQPASNLDIELAHKHFAAGCFNKTWTYINMTGCTPADDEAMILCAHASLWHWTQRADCTDRNLSIGHWQLARVLTLAGRASDALSHARQSLQYAQTEPAFYLGFAHEAIARAAKALNETNLLREHLHKANTCAAAVTDAEDRELLEKDLRELE